MKSLILCTLAALIFVSCEKPDREIESMLSQFEKKAAAAIQRQQELEAELVEQKILAERDAIERERTMIEQERIAMEQLRDAENEAAANELERRQAELLEREQNISEVQSELDSRQQEIRGLETELNERELELAGREPIDALPPIDKDYVSGPTGDFNNFYEPLGAYGSWFQTRDYGYVYQPTVVRDVTWRPYTRGRWAFTNQGWTWVSSEPFGWACYHYGRWALLRDIGWVWVPGSEWAPAWVTWRESTDHIGWAPLPPETLAWNDYSWDSSVETRFVIDAGWFSFISYRHFGSNIFTRCLPISQNVVICRNTTNITHYVRRNRCVFVGGPRYRNVCTRIGRDFPIHRLHMDHSPEFGRGGRRLSSQFSGNELNVVAPRMDAEWNRALRPSRVSRDLGDVVVDRSKEVTTDIRQQYLDRKNEEDRKAQRLVTQAGGRESFERERLNHLEKNRQEVAKNELESRGHKNVSQRIGKEQKRSEKPKDNGNTDQPIGQNNLAKDRNSKRKIPEVPTIPVDGNGPSIAVPSLTDLELRESRQGKSQLNKLPRGLVPIPPVLENNPTVNPLVEPPIILKDRDLNANQKRPQLSTNRDLELKSKIDKQAARELHRQQEAAREESLRAESALKLQQEQQEKSNRQQVLENQKNTQKQERFEIAQRKQQEKQESLNQQLEVAKRTREQKQQEEKIREQQQEQSRKLQQERSLEQQQQEVKRKQQEENQLLVREQQDQLRAQKDQQEKMRAQQERQERARQQQEEAQRRAQEQQERLRAQQEQQEKMRTQQEEVQRRAQEQQERLRAQQEQQERMRAQQEQQERARQQQEEARRRAQEQQQAQQEQQERMRAQQEQMERSRQRQEEAQRRNQEQQQEQQERSRQRQKGQNK